MNWAPLLLSVCIVEGTALAPDGAPLGNVEVRHAPTREALGRTAADGTFRVEVPGPGSAVVLEFRGDGLPTAVRETRCGETVQVRLAAAAMETVEISATRLDADAADAAVTVDHLDAREVASAAGSVPAIAQAIQQLPGVGAVGRDGFTAAPTIRGLGRDRSLVLLEGVRLSSDRGVGPSGSFLDPFLIESVDVVRGASGVAYGSGALGGVVSLGLGPAPATAHRALRLGGTSNGEGFLAAGRAGGRMDRDWSGSIGGFFRSHGDYSFPSGDGLPSGAAVNSGMENLGGAVVLERPLRAGGLRVSVVGTSASEVGRPLTRSRRLDTIQTEDHFLTSVQYSAARAGSRTQISAGAHRPYTLNRTERFDSFGQPSRTGRTENFSWDATAAVLIERPTGRGSWLAGLDGFARRDADASETNVFFPASGAPDEITFETVRLVTDGSRTDVGAFAGWKRTIGSASEVLIAGRLDWLARGANEQPSADWVAPSASVAFRHPLSPAWTWKGTIGRSFRAPRIQELYFQGDRPGGSRLANPELDPEQAWSAETGLHLGAGDWSAEATVFGIRADDLIVQLPVDAAGDTLRSENVADARIRGVEVGAAWRHPEGRASAAVAYAVLRGEDSGGTALPDIPSGEVRWTGDWQAWRGERGREARLRAALRAGGAKTPFASGLDDRWYADFLGSGGIGGDEMGHPGFARLDLGVRARLHPAAEIDLLVTNVLDARYLDRPETDAYPQPGRSLQAQLTLGNRIP